MARQLLRDVKDAKCTAWDGKTTKMGDCASPLVSRRDLRERGGGGGGGGGVTCHSCGSA